MNEGPLLSADEFVKLALVYATQDISCILFDYINEDRDWSEKAKSEALKYKEFLESKKTTLTFGDLHEYIVSSLAQAFIHPIFSSVGYNGNSTLRRYLLERVQLYPATTVDAKIAYNNFTDDKKKEVVQKYIDELPKLTDRIRKHEKNLFKPLDEDEFQLLEVENDNNDVSVKSKMKHG